MVSGGEAVINIHDAINARPAEPREDAVSRSIPANITKHTSARKINAKNYKTILYHCKILQFEEQ